MGRGREERDLGPRGVRAGPRGRDTVHRREFTADLQRLTAQGRWWFSQRRLTRDNILNATAELFFHQLREDTDFLSLVTLLASALEFQAILGVKKRGSKKERKERQGRIDELEKQLNARREQWGVEEGVMMRKESRIGVENAVAKRARALIWAHLLRVELDDKELQSGWSRLRTC